ncbi:ATP-binding cassette domain-containing protein [Caulobacter sp. SLTY]|uniref:ABC transporter ATP-binding protein n=1 Tax=Caulobacter sp. SLTY TaxID=2683262 RepID=UPI001411F339|nr:ABC transporter ATP-binding protein [Caulobacter sp. SLTY]NBB17140.1 ATP-binding cassette domain-containing protein [Caulobacter sp. SLTY]
MSEPTLSLRGVKRDYKTGSGELHVLRGVDLDVNPGEIVGLIGPSGSGKSSLLHAAGLLEHPTEGSVTIAGRDCTHLGDGPRSQVRLDSIGFVYQFHHLLPEFTALENVAMPALIAGRDRGQTQERATGLLTDLGLAERTDHQPAQLSGGEQQRVAIARALMNKPILLLADEPTGNLDPDTAASVFQALHDLVRNHGVAALIATHNLELARYMDRVFALKEGHLEERTF